MSPKLHTFPKPVSDPDATGYSQDDSSDGTLSPFHSATDVATATSTPGARDGVLTLFPGNVSAASMQATGKPTA